MILQNVLLQISFFSIVSSSSAYAEHLGGTATFSGLVIGIPTAVSGFMLIPLMKIDRGRYKLPLHISCGSMALGSILYGLAYKANFLYLILLGRMVQGIGFIGFLYTKRYCTDPRIVGIRRRTTLAGWLVLGQGIGMSAGPFFGGLLYKVGFDSLVFNGYTGPGWVMAGVWLIFWAVCAVFFEDVPRENSSQSQSMEMTSLPLPAPTQSAGTHLSARQWGVVSTMCWFAMTCFFILGAWESNIPVFASSSSSSTIAHAAPISLKFLPRAYPLSPFHWSPFASGNFIALGGAAIFPFLFLNLLLARRTQDRHILALGAGLGLAGLLTALALLHTQPGTGVLSYGAFFACWFLVALGFNLASTCTLSLLSKQLPASWNGRTSLAIQYSNYLGRVTGAVWGGSGVKVGMLNYLGLEIAIIGIGAVMFLTLWRELKAKTG
ncbi:major facilitator superfamily domain-containing protein [Phellopilus nigrolimitatus]|nr:major facilitator superfamily domain-containing protein [Phellopilus nigrolimitatus]